MAERREMIGLGLLFGAMYFIQGVAEPTEGLIAQPVRSLLKSWGQSTGEIAALMALVAVPWSLKPLYGLLSDFVPILGSRRRNYLLLTTVAAAVGLGWLYVVPISPGQTQVLFWLLLIPTVCVAFSDVLVDALMVEVGQPRGMTGRLQSIQWAAIYAATILTGFVGGWLTQHGHQDWAFLICAAAIAVSLSLVIFLVHEPRSAGPRSSLRQTAGSLWQAVRSPAVFFSAAFLFLWNFNPFSATVLYMYETGELNLSEQFYGNMVSLAAVLAVVASVAYGFYCRRVPFRWLIHISIVMGVLTTLVYLGLSGPRSAVLATCLAGFTYMTGSLIQLDLAARVCPPQVAGTVFATLMAVSNLGVILASAIGGWLYDQLAASWGKHHAFDLLVVIGAASTSLCWLLVSLLRKVTTKDFF